jgi:hypothetical protein
MPPRCCSHNGCQCMTTQAEQALWPTGSRSGNKYWYKLLVSNWYCLVRARQVNRFEVWSTNYQLSVELGNNNTSIQLAKSYLCLVRLVVCASQVDSGRLLQPSVDQSTRYKWSQGRLGARCACGGHIYSVSTWFRWHCLRVYFYATSSPHWCSHVMAGTSDDPLTSMLAH